MEKLIKYLKPKTIAAIIADLEDRNNWGGLPTELLKILNALKNEN